ncbi:hypothetical protein [Klebsiella quasipneumoniae]|uniref:hypothetical protein n=2 Tax=Klebsiella quasipneumoniae TaxID=1463165 RepID=UPI00164A18FD|nr:hypothetical protein [Klebsiella quasipneumoniae]MBC5078542.1 hypothetical protein [Klebsiella quasipneumoniae]MBC5183301.1 hypothetical protein [Klebsiella quasipneumoniae]
MSFPAINMWDSIGKVTSGFTLLALIIIAALFAYRIKMDWNLKNLKNSKGDERVRIIKILSDSYEIDISGLSKLQEYSIVMEQLNQKRQRYFLQIISFTTFMLLFSLIALYAMYKYNKDKGENKKDINDAKNSTTNHQLQTLTTTSVTPVKQVINNNTINNSHSGMKNKAVNTVAQDENFIIDKKSKPLDAILAEIKSTKDKVKLKSLQIQARSILQPQYDFGTISIKKKNTFTFLSKYKFISYDYNSNILELNFNGKVYYNDTRKLRNAINANVKIYLNKAFNLDMDYDSSFSITCVEFGNGCITFQPISGICGGYINKTFPECLKDDPSAYYLVSSNSISFYNNNNGGLNMLYTTLKTEHEKISRSIPDNN